MEINTNTVNILKNFAAINSNIVIKPGNKLMTISEAKNVLAEATVTETFDKTIGIYDLQEFLNVLSLVDNPRVQFDEKYMNIVGLSGRDTVKYYYADIDMLTSPSKAIEMPEADIRFTLDESTLTGLKRAAAIFGHDQLAIEPSNNAIKLSVIDPENATANEYSIEANGWYNNDHFKFILNISNLKMVSDNYDVKISSKLISEFTNESKTLKYWVALEKSSSYGV